MTFTAEWEKEVKAADEQLIQLVRIEAFAEREAESVACTLDISYRWNHEGAAWEGPGELDLTADELDALIEMLTNLRNSL